MEVECFLGHWFRVSGNFPWTSDSKHAHCIEMAAGEQRIKGTLPILCSPITTVNILEVFYFICVAK